MRRWVAALAALVTFFSSSAALAQEKYKEMPPIFSTSVEGVERKIDGNSTFVYKEYLQTTNKQVNERLRGIVDGYDEQLAAKVQPDPKKKASLNSRLDIHMIYYRTGDRFISTMVQARTAYYRELMDLKMTTGTYDLSTGEQIALTELIDPAGAGWETLAKGVKAQMQALYPGQPRDESAIAALCTREALEAAEFTLSGMELTLHYPAKFIFEGKKHLIHVRFYYPELSGMLTPLGMQATDNSRWKMVAMTCDDGPKDYSSTYVLDAFRKAGARVTYFIVTKQLERYADVYLRQHDQNHGFGSHSHNHWSGYSIKIVKNRVKEVEKSLELMAAVTGEAPHFFRAPGGTYPPWVESKLPLPIIQWSLDTHDFKGKKPKEILSTVRKAVQDYDILLFHDTGKYLQDAVPLMADYFEKNGYMMVTLDELLQAQGVVAENNVVYWSFRPGENSLDRSNLGKKK